ncbi:unnamed protein product [Oncorhynchus mykiss]|uniref:Uncharacterized protein n=1 Tax=Oncorhynchus mykiss TaxID=8022 RepID=A0A060Z327_ONCMY|nr:unnamed protein product [Oncorhynchus mykiss]
MSFSFLSFNISPQRPFLLLSLQLPIDFQERVSSHMEKQGRGVTMALCHSPYSDAVPTAVIAKVLEKPEPGSSCPNTSSPSPQPLEDEGHDHNFVPTSAGGGTESLRRRTAYRTSDLYCSDTALYCPERWQERRQSVDVHARPMGLLLQSQNSTDSNPEEEAFQSGNFSHHGAHSFHGEFAAGSLRASSSYSSFSQASEDEKGGKAAAVAPVAPCPPPTMGSTWTGGMERKSTSSYEKDSPPGHSVFPKSHSFQHMAMPPSPSPAKGGGCSSPAYVCTASCGYSEPYHSPLIASSHSVGSAQGGGPRGVERSDSQASMVSMGVPTEEELTGRWRQLSVEDINSYSFNRNPGRVSPYSFSEQHFAMGPAKIKLGPLYSSFHEGDDNVFLHSHVLDQCLAAAASGGLSPSPSPTGQSPALYRAKVDSQDSECSLQFLSGSLKDKESGAAGASGGSMNKEYVDVSPNSSAESLHHQSSLEASSLQHCQRERMRPSPSPALPKKSSQQYQKFGSTGTGLSRKDSLTKAQLYGTLLN